MKARTRRFSRYKGYDYTRGASLFITIVTEPRYPRFGRVINGAVALSPLGAIVADSLRTLSKREDDITIFGRVVMPDHIHCRVYLKPGSENALKALGRLIGSFKSYTTRKSWETGLSGRLWEQGYHDRICSTRAFIDAVERYILYNPLKYELRYNHPEHLRIHEPLDSQRLDHETFWRGIGNTRLLGDSAKLLGLRISRRLDTPVAIGRVVGRCRDATKAGYTILSGFISPGEKAVRDALLETPEAQLILILPTSIPHDYMPESRYLKALSENRLLIVAKGNESTPFSRTACDALNADVLHIATTGKGLFTYWRSSGCEQIAGTEACSQDAPPPSS